MPHLEHGNEVSEFFTYKEVYKYLKLFMDSEDLPMEPFAYINARAVAYNPGVTAEDKINQLRMLLHADSLLRLSRLGPPDFPERETISG